MTPDELAEEIMIDLAATSRTLQNITDIRAAIVDRDPNVHELAAIGAYVRDIYNGIENIFVRIAKFRGISLAESGDWHKNLLAMFSDPPHAGLPLLVREPMLEGIKAFRGFRHVMHKRYAADLDWKKPKPLVNDATNIVTSIGSSVRAFLSGLGATILE